MTAMAIGIGNTTNWAFEATWVVLAVATHALFLGVMPTMPPPQKFDVSDEVAVAIIDEPTEEPITEAPVEEEVEAEEAPEPEPVRPPPKPKTYKAPKDPPQAPEEPPAAAKETPVAFDNIVLTNESSEPSDWAVDPGSGQSREGPMGSPDAVVTGRSRDGVIGGIIGGTGIGVVVDVGDLSRQPIPPSLRKKLEKLYPKKARTEGVEGVAIVRVQINPDGKPSKIRILSEKPLGYGFGDACIRAHQGESWGPGVDKDGKRVTTRVTFTCGFEIRY